jgi:hypothetical protein
MNVALYLHFLKIIQIVSSRHQSLTRLFRHFPRVFELILKCGSMTVHQLVLANFYSHLEQKERGLSFYYHTALKTSRLRVGHTNQLAINIFILKQIPNGSVILYEHIEIFTKS